VKLKEKDLNSGSLLIKKYIGTEFKGSFRYERKIQSEMELSNIIIGIVITSMGVGIVFVGNYFSKKIGILHIVIYFMASFVIFGGVVILFLYDKVPIF